MNITVLGEAQYPSSNRRPVNDQARIPAHIVRVPGAPPQEELLFELAGPRAKLCFDPKHTRAGIVTCGGLCPGLNDVIRSLFLELHDAYGVQPIELAEDPENWRDHARIWLREHEAPGSIAMLVAGPSPRNPDANHRIEFLRVGERTEKPAP
jgi:hypothetical protein